MPSIPPLARLLPMGFFLAVAATLPLCLAQAWWSLGGVWTAIAFFFLYPTLKPNTAWMGPIATRFRTEGREVWLTIDDGPDPKDTPRLLAALARHGARATFFLIGAKAERQPELVRAILREGHAVANHSFSHPVATFWMASPGRAGREIDRGAAVLAAVIGEGAPTLFRAPVGMANPFVFSALRRRGIALVGWSARGFDAVATDPRIVVERIWRTVQPGAIVLLHEGHGREGFHPHCLELLLDRLAEAGYACIVPGRDRFES